MPPGGHLETFLTVTSWGERLPSRNGWGSGMLCAGQPLSPSPRCQPCRGREIWSVGLLGRVPLASDLGREMVGLWVWEGVGTGSPPRQHGNGEEAGARAPRASRCGGNRTSPLSRGIWPPGATGARGASRGRLPPPPPPTPRPGEAVQPRPSPALSAWLQLFLGLLLSSWEKA